jgi:hypothetical protein
MDRYGLVEHLATLCGALETTRTPYALAGGLAYSALVEPRATMDIDVLVLLESGNIRGITAEIEKSYDSVVVHREPMLFNRTRIWRMVCVSAGIEFIIDFILADSEFQQQAVRRAKSVEYAGARISILTIEDLVLMKTIASRPQDISDLENIKLLMNDSVDWKYVDSWEKELGLA